MHQRLRQRPDPRHRSVRRRESVDRPARPRLRPATGDQDGVADSRHRRVAKPDGKRGHPAGASGADRDNSVRPRRAGEASHCERRPTHLRNREVGQRRRQPADDPHTPGLRVKRGNACVARNLASSNDDQAPPPTRRRRRVVDREGEAPAGRHGRAANDRDGGGGAAAGIEAAERVGSVSEHRNRGILYGGRERRDLANANPRRAGGHPMRCLCRRLPRRGRVGHGARGAGVRGGLSGAEQMNRPDGGDDDDGEDDHASRSAHATLPARPAPPPIAPSEVVGGGHAGTVRRSDERRLTRAARALSSRAVCHDPDSGPPIPPIAGASVSHDDLVLEAADGTRFAAFAAGPDAPARCGVVVLPDVRGLHHFYEELALRLGEQGIAAVAIDYFGRTAGVGKRDEDFPYAEHVPLTTGAGIQADVGAAVSHLRSQRCPGRLHGRLLLRRAPLVALDGGRARARRRRRLLRLDRPAKRRARADPAGGRVPRADPRAHGRRRPGDHGGRRCRVRLGPRRGRRGARRRDLRRAPHSFFDRKQEQFADASADAWRRVLAFFESHTPA